MNKYIKIYISTKYVHTERRGVIVDIVNLKEEIVKIHYDKHKMTEEICLKNADWTIVIALTAYSSDCYRK